MKLKILINGLLNIKEMISCKSGVTQELNFVCLFVAQQSLQYLCIKTEL